MRAHCLAAMLLAGLPGIASAQATQVPFSGLQYDAAAQVEITSDALEIDQATGTALFTGAVRVAQGNLRLAADRIEVFYASSSGSQRGAIQRMVATGNVTLTNGVEAAEAERATYEVASGIIEMDGDVLLTQGQNALSSEALRIDLNSGTGVLQGRVTTTFVPESAP